MTLEHAEPEELAAFENWRKAARRNSQYADATAYCASLMWIFPFLVLGLLVFPLLSIRQKRRALALQRIFPAIPNGFKWLDAKKQESPITGAPESAKARDTRRILPGLVAGLAAVAGGVFWIVRSAEPEPKISGKPLSHWVEGISDFDPRVRSEALYKLQHAAPEHLEKHRGKLEKAAEYNPAARELLHEKFPSSW